MLQGDRPTRLQCAQPANFAYVTPCCGEIVHICLTTCCIYRVNRDGPPGSLCPGGCLDPIFGVGELPLVDAQLLVVPSIDGFEEGEGEWQISNTPNPLLKSPSFKKPSLDDLEAFARLRESRDEERAQTPATPCKPGRKEKPK